MPTPVILLETCRGVKPSGCPHAAPLPWDWVAALVNQAAAVPQPAALAEHSVAAYVRHMRPGLRFGDILSPNGLPGLPAWVLS